MSNKYYWLMLSTDQIAAIEAAGLSDLAKELRGEIAEIESEAASDCRAEAYDDDKHTPEWSGPVSFCDDGKAWVMTWELVDDPNADEEDEDESGLADETADKAKRRAG